MVSFAHPMLVQAAQVLQAEQAAARIREQPITGLNTNPVMAGQELGFLDRALGGAARLGEAYGDFLASDGLTGVINRNFGTSLVPIPRQSPLEIALGFAGTVGPIKRVAKGASKAASRTSSKFELDFFGRPIQILQNPSKERLMGLARRSKFTALRRIRDPETGDVYVWDAADPALHEFVAKQLGLKVDARAFDGLFLEGDELVKATR